MGISKMRGGWPSQSLFSHKMVGKWDSGAGGHDLALLQECRLHSFYYDGSITSAHRADTTAQPSPSGTIQRSSGWRTNDALSSAGVSSTQAAQPSPSGVAHSTAG